MRAFTILFFFLTVNFSNAQENSVQLQLLKEAEQNHNNFDENPQHSFERAGLILKQANEIEAHKAELTALMTQCKFYRSAADYENMMLFARNLEAKANEYRESAYIAGALVYQSEIYFNNSQSQKWKTALKRALDILEKSPHDDSLTIIGKSNVYVCLANYHKDFKTKLSYIRKSVELNLKYKKMEDLYRNYTNLAVIYYDQNLDSSKYYAQLSLDAGAKNEHVFINYIVLGKAALKEGNYEKVIDYGQRAEELKGHKEWANLQSLYNNLIEAYDKLNDTKSAAKYRSKNDSLKILISENQKKYLIRALNEKEKPVIGKGIWIILSVGFIFFIFLIFLILRNRKKRNVLEENRILENETQYDYSKLVELLQKKDKSFMMHFEEAFPDFSRKLLELNPKMVRTEIEFCALLKLKIPTKDIAIYTNVEAKTVRNKKYRIKKKLNIPDGTDIYQWFHDF